MDKINEDGNDRPENLSKEGANSTEQVELQMVPNSSNEEGEFVKKQQCKKATRV